jgi:transposase-like protein
VTRRFKPHPRPGGRGIYRNDPALSGLFPNEASALRLVSAVLMEISEDWETNRKYLTMGPG